MALVIGALFIFGALFLIFAAVGGMANQQSGVSRSLAVLQAMTDAPEELTSELERPFGERILEPLYGRLQALGRRITGADQVERIRQKLDKAGNPAGWTVDRVATGKVLGVICGFVFAGLLALMLHKGIGVSAVLIGVGSVLGFNGPTIFLYNTALKRDETMQREIADAIDLLTISVEAGLGFDAALQQVARNTTGPLAEEFAASCRRCRSAEAAPMRSARWVTGPHPRDPRLHQRRWCRPTPSASRSRRCCASSRRRCVSSDASVPRRRPHRSR
jgi:tight adherence protein C